MLPARVPYDSFLLTGTSQWRFRWVASTSIILTLLENPGLFRVAEAVTVMFFHTFPLYYNQDNQAPNWFKATEVPLRNLLSSRRAYVGVSPKCTNALEVEYGICKQNQYFESYRISAADKQDSRGARVAALLAAVSL